MAGSNFFSTGLTQQSDTAIYLSDIIISTFNLCRKFSMRFSADSNQWKQAKICAILKWVIVRRLKITDQYKSDP